MSPAQSKGKVRGPDRHAWFIQDLILDRVRGVLTPVEGRLARDPAGHHLIKEVRKRLIEGARPLLDNMIQRLSRVWVVSLHSDVGVRTDERSIVLSLAGDLGARFGWYSLACRECLVCLGHLRAANGEQGMAHDDGRVLSPGPGQLHLNWFTT